MQASMHPNLHVSQGQSSTANPKSVLYLQKTKKRENNLVLYIYYKVKNINKIYLWTHIIENKKHMNAFKFHVLMTFLIYIFICIIE